MQVHHKFPTAPPGRAASVGLALTIGTFDGVHCGHGILIDALKREAVARKLTTAALTFEDMPYCFFRPDDCPRLLTLPDEKIAAFAPYKLDHLLLVPFTAELAGLDAEAFVMGTLIEKLNLKLLVVGPDFALGRGRTGDVEALRNFGEWYGFEVVALDEKLLADKTPISSTRVRECVEQGRLEEAMRLLGRPFTLAGDVVPGMQLGSSIGVPTINIRPHTRKVLPRNGVYAARAYFDDRPLPHPAALNIGFRPTVGAGLQQSIEFHVIGEHIPRPPKRARLEIVKWLRDEQKFPDLNALVAQIKTDIVYAGEALK